MGLLDECFNNVATLPEQYLSPVILNGRVSFSEVGIDDVAKAFRRLAGDPHLKTKPYLRTYRAGRMVPEIEREIWKRAPAEEEQIHTWFAALFGGEPSGIILNKAERWASELTTKLAPHLRELRAAYPLTVEFQIVLFVGDYGFTPFGVHRDEPCASVIHLNLGPAKKTFLIFDPKVSNSPGFLSDVSIPKLLRIAKSFNAEQGDIFFLPANYYHVAEAREFSVDVSCKVTVRRPHEISRHILSEVAKHGEITERASNSVESSLKELLGISSAHSPDVCEQLLSDAQMCWSSNAGFSEPPKERSLEGIDCRNKFCMLSDFPIYWRPCEDRLKIFVRGRIFQAERTSAAFQLLSTLSTGECIIPSKLSAANLRLAKQLIVMCGLVEIPFD